MRFRIAITVGILAVVGLFVLIPMRKPTMSGRDSYNLSKEAQPSKIQSDNSPVAVPVPGEKAVRRYHATIAVEIAAIVWSFLSLALLLFTGWSARIRSWAVRQRRNWYSTFVLYALAFGFLYFMVNLPSIYYAGYVLPHNFELTNQTFGRWLANTLKGAGVVMLASLALDWIPFQIFKNSPRRWWLWLALFVPLFLSARIFIEPVLIDPIFHQFGPLPDKTLEAKVLAQAGRAGIEGSRLYVANMSLDTKLDNAYVAGLFGTKRIVFWDNILKDLNEEELLFVLGHEMGHYVLHHKFKRIAFTSLLAFVSLYVAYRLTGPLIGRFKSRWGFDSPADIAAAPLVILVFLLLGFVGLPASMAFSRHLEHEADRFGLELTHSNHAAAMVFVKLTQNGLSVYRPVPIVQFWSGSHPSAAERIEFCNQYRPWESGQPSLYEEYIKK